MGQVLVKDTSEAIEKLSSTEISLPSGAFLTIGGQQYSNLIDSVMDVGASNGVGGLDTGAIAADTTYFVHAVPSQFFANVGDLGLVASLSADLPTGFNASAVCGRFTTDGSSNIDRIDDSEHDDDRAALAELKRSLDTVELKFIDVLNTEITNRAQMVDLANDLSAHAGINRIAIQEIFEIQGESGPSDEMVFGVTNDKFNQIRVVGPWVNRNDALGVRTLIETASTEGFLEFTFYGTGLNLVWFNDVTSRPIFLTIDGGAESGDLQPSGTGSGVLSNRLYNPNQIVPLASGLSLGLHTAKIRFTNFPNVYGLETLNESTNIQVNPGQLANGRQLASHSSPFATSFNSETGTDVGAGGAVVMYEEDGIIKKAVNWAADSQGNLASASHSNEEIIGYHNFREFGAGRTDDLPSLTTSAADKAFTLDDDTTTLVVDNNAVDSGDFGRRGIFQNGAGHTTLTFVGTGLDMFAWRSIALTATYQIFVDGSEVTAGATSGATLFPNISPGIGAQKIVSGLKYGTHTVKIERIAGATGFTIGDFIVYGPKKPTLPDGAIPLHEYNLMADFDESGATSTGLSSLSPVQGALWKTCLREVVYKGTWSVGGVAATARDRTAGQVFSTVNGDSFEYTFWGDNLTFEFDAPSANNTLTVEIDGVLDATGIAGTGNITNSGGGTYSLTTPDNARAYLTFKNLTLGLHTVTVTKTAAAGSLELNGIFIGTPIHFPKLNGSATLMNTLRVGSQGISDKRKFSESQIPDQPNYVMANLNHITDTVAAAFDFPVEGMNATIETSGRPIEIEYSIAASNDTGGRISFTKIFIQGIEIKPVVQLDTNTANAEQMHSFKAIARVGAGQHNIIVTGQTNANTWQVGARSLIVKELKR